MSLAALESPFPIPRGVALALAAAGPVAIGGVLAATSPALYIAIAATGDAPPAARVVRALLIGLGAFGIALAGLVVPAAFLSLSSISAETAVGFTSAALGAAAVIGFRRLSRELQMQSAGASFVFVVWAVATLGLAARLWWNLSAEVMS